MPGKNSGGLAVMPAVTEVTLNKPDQSKPIEIEYTNHNKQKMRLELFAMDFKQNPDNPNLLFLNESQLDNPYSLVSYLQFDSHLLQLEPGETQKVIVRAVNEQELSPGGHYAAIIAREVSDWNVKTNTSVFSPAVSTLVLLRKKGGERFNLSLKQVQWPSKMLVTRYPTEIMLTFQNQGNIHLVPYGRLEIRDQFNRLISKGILNRNSARVFPEGTREIPAYFIKTAPSWPLSINTLTLQGQDSLKKVSYQHRDSFIYFDYRLILGLLLVIGFFLFRKLKKK